MSFPENPPERRALAWAMAASLVIHAWVLLVSHHDPAGAGGPTRLEARLAPRAPANPLPSTPSAVQSKPSAERSPKAAHRRNLLTAEKSRGPAVASPPRWSTAEKAEMNDFLDELARETRVQPKPTLAQRSLAMAREQARQMAQGDASGDALLEQRPNGPPADPFSLELYLDGLVRRLNQSAGFVRNDPRSKGIRPAAVQFRLNPDGSLKTFKVINAGDQADEIAFIRAVVERAVPFSPFPPDIDRAAKSLGIVICIQPGSGGGLGFTRKADGRGC